MALIAPNEGETRLLERAMGKSANGDLTLSLFTNDLTVAETTTFSELVPPVGNNYADVNLTGATWSAGVGGDPSTISYPEQIFTFSAGPVTVYGYAVCEGSRIMWVERFTDGPYSIPSGGGTIRITLNITLQDLQD